MPPEALDEHKKKNKALAQIGHKDIGKALPGKPVMAKAAKKDVNSIMTQVLNKYKSNNPPAAQVKDDKKPAATQEVEAEADIDVSQESQLADQIRS